MDHGKRKHVGGRSGKPHAKPKVTPKGSAVPARPAPSARPAPKGSARAGPKGPAGHGGKAARPGGHRPHRPHRPAAPHHGQQAQRPHAHAHAPAPRPARQARPAAGRRNAVSTEWGNVAEWYDKLVGDEGSEYHREVIFPGLLKLLDLEPGATVVDVACGQGALCRLLKEKGFRPTGVDAAVELIQMARQRSDPGIPFYVGDARELTFLRSNYFDAATCVLAIQNIDRVQPVFEGVRRALAYGGKFVTVMVHPCFRGPRSTSWGWDEERGVQFRRVDRYLVPRKEPIIAHPGAKDGTYTWTFHRPLQSYVKALRGAGLLVDAIEEWTSHRTSTSGPRAGAENDARREIPLFMAIRAVKVPPPRTEHDEDEAHRRQQLPPQPQLPPAPQQPGQEQRPAAGQAAGPKPA